MPIDRRSSARPHSRTSTPSTRTAPGAGVVEPQQQVGQGALAGAGVADHRDRLTRPRLERDVGQHRLVRQIGEVDPIELELAPNPLRAVRPRRLDDLRRPVEQPEDALGAGHGALQDVVLLRQVGQRQVEALGVLEEGHQPADRQRAGDHLALRRTRG